MSKKPEPPRKEGEESGYPQVRADADGRNYHLDLLGRKVYHEAPAPEPTLAETLAAEPSWRDPSG